LRCIVFLSDQAAHDRDSQQFGVKRQSMGASHSNSAAADRSQYQAAAADRWLTVHLPVAAVPHASPGCSSSITTGAGSSASLNASHVRHVHGTDGTIQLAPGGRGVREDSNKEQGRAHQGKTAVESAGADAGSLKSSGSFASIGGRSNSSYDDDTVPELTAADSGVL
jgi:hypothetical protein